MKGAEPVLPGEVPEYDEIFDDLKKSKERCQKKVFKLVALRDFTEYQLAGLQYDVDVCLKAGIKPDPDLQHEYEKYQDKTNKIRNRVRYASTHLYQQHYVLAGINLDISNEPPPLPFAAAPSPADLDDILKFKFETTLRKLRGRMIPELVSEKNEIMMRIRMANELMLSDMLDLDPERRPTVEQIKEYIGKEHENLARIEQELEIFGRAVRLVSDRLARLNERGNYSSMFISDSYSQSEDETIVFPM
jgi:hypothetical protein